MATLTTPVKVFPSGAGHLSQYGIGHCSTTDGTATKVHIKTSILKPAGVGPMVTIEALGFAYGSAQAIRSSWSFYAYQNSLIHIGFSNIYPGMVAEAVYYSTDNYVCLRGGLTSYFSGFILNAYVCAGDSPGTPITVTASAWNTNAGNFY